MWCKWKVALVIFWFFWHFHFSMNPKLLQSFFFLWLCGGCAIYAGLKWERKRWNRSVSSYVPFRLTGISINERRTEVFEARFYPQHNIYSFKARVLYTAFILNKPYKIKASSEQEKSEWNRTKCCENYKFQTKLTRAFCVKFVLLMLVFMLETHSYELLVYYCGICCVCKISHGLSASHFTLYLGERKHISLFLLLAHNVDEKNKIKTFRWNHDHFLPLCKVFETKINFISASICKTK